jgi:hypothetical protein
MAGRKAISYFMAHSYGNFSDVGGWQRRAVQADIPLPSSSQYESKYFC